MLRTSCGASVPFQDAIRHATVTAVDQRRGSTHTIAQQVRRQSIPDCIAQRVYLIVQAVFPLLLFIAKMGMILIIVPQYILKRDSRCTQFMYQAYETERTLSFYHAAKGGGGS